MSIRNRTRILFAAAALVAAGAPARAWWASGHETIARGALQNLGGTGDLQRFFAETDDQFTKIPRIEPASAHFINIDFPGTTTGNAGTVSYATDFANFRAGTFTFPTTLAAANARYGSGYVSGLGGVPWTAAATLSTLTDKMKTAVTYDDWYRLLPTAGALAHYIEDMHQPLHLTKDFNDGTGIHANYEGAQFENGTVRRYPELLAAVTPVAPTYYGPTSGGGFVTALFSRIPTDYDKIVAIRTANTVARAAGTGAVFYDSLWNQTKAITKDSFQDAAAVIGSALYTAYVNAGSPAIPQATFFATPAKEQSTIIATGPVAGYTNEDFFQVRGTATPSYGVARFDMATIRARYDARYGAGMWGVDNLAFATEVSSSSSGSLAIYYSPDDATNIQAGSALRYSDGAAPLGVNFSADAPLLQYAITSKPTYTITRFDSATPEAFRWSPLQADVLTGGVVTLVVAPGTSATSATYFGGAGLSLEVSAHALGDANRDGRIDADDYALVDRGFAARLTGWANGDFDADGTVSPADYLLLDRAFLLHNPAAAPGLLASREAQFGPDYVATLTSSVPEPAALALTAVFLPALGRGRGRPHPKRPASR